MACLQEALCLYDRLLSEKGHSSAACPTAQAFPVASQASPGQDQARLRPCSSWPGGALQVGG